jgi:hypothetical protein
MHMQCSSKGLQRRGSSFRNESESGGKAFGLDMKDESLQK